MKRDFCVCQGPDKKRGCGLCASPIQEMNTISAPASSVKAGIDVVPVSVRERGVVFLPVSYD